MNLSERIGIVLRRYRNHHHMAQIDLAAASDSDRSFISEVENGKRNISMETFVRLCNALEAEAWQVLKEAMEERKKK